jgi:uncharacterized protein
MPIQIGKNETKVRIKVKPGAKRSAILGIVSLPDGTKALEVAVHAPPIDGAANDALIALLSKNWHIRKSAFSISHGLTGRIKLVVIEGSPDLKLDTP